MNYLKKALAYSLKPHELGYCGPCEVDASSAKLRGYLAGEKYSEHEILGLLKQFKGAVTYFNLIARLNNIENPFDEKVIEAYWLGNELLENVKVDDIKKMVFAEFVGPGLLTQDRAQEIVDKFPKIAYAHHTFHVFFIGAVTNRVKLVGAMRDNCKVSWGKITQIFPETNQVEVLTQKLFPEVEVVEKITWDKIIVPELKVGDTVSAHWDRVSEVITAQKLNNLVKYTMLNYRELEKIYAADKN